MNKKMEAKCFRDIRDVVFGLSDEDWRAVSRDLSYKYTRLELAIVCSSLVKILSSLLIECVLPLLIDAVGIEAVLRTEIKLREKHTERGSRTQGSPEDPSDYISSFIQGLVSQIKEAMKQALMKFSSKPATAGETSSEHPLIDDLSASSTKAIITEIIRLCYPDIYYKTMKRKKPESFQQVINSIAKAMEHIQKVHRFSSMSDALGESDIEKGTMSDGGDENVFSEHVRTKAAHVISSILHEASEEVASAGSTHSDSASLDEITVLASSVRVHPTASKITKTLLKGLKKQPSSDEMSTLMFSRKKFFPAACETYSCVQKKVFRFLLKVEASVSPKEEPPVKSVKRESHQLASGNSEASSSKLSSECVSMSLMKAVKANVSSTSAQEEEQFHLDTCTDEMIGKILDLYRKQEQKLTSDLFQSTCAQLVRDVLVRNVQILEKKQKHRKPAKSLSFRKISRDVIRYLDSAASEMTHSVSRELEECLEAESRNETQTGIPRASNLSAFDHANIFAPFRLFKHVRNDMENIFSTVNEGRRSNGSAETMSANDKVTFDSVYEISIKEDGTVVKRPSSDVSRGFAGRQAGNVNSAVNQLKSLLSRDSGTRHHETTIANAVSTILRNMTATSNITRRFSEECAALTEERSRGGASGALGISRLVHGFVPELITHLERYFSSTEFSQMAVQTEFCKGELTSCHEEAFTAAVSELTKSLTDFVVESAATSATPMRRTRNTKMLDELNARIQERQLTALDDEFSHPSVRGSAGKEKKTKEKRKKRKHFTVGKKASRSSDPEKAKQSKIESCPSANQEVHFWHQQNGNDASLRETVGSFLRRKFAGFSSSMRSVFTSLRVRRSI